jgi:hypothetical protein
MEACQPPEFLNSVQLQFNSEGVRMKFLSVAIAAVALVTFASCEEPPVVNVGAKFLVSGKVTDSSGAARVVGGSDNVELCLRVSYTELSKGQNIRSGTASSCIGLVTDQTGTYNMVRTIGLQTYGDQIRIENAKIYGRTYDSAAQAYILLGPTIRKVEITQAGGVIEADIALFDY